MKQLGVLQIGNGWFPERKGGVENVFYNLCLQLPSQGIEVRGLVPGSAGIADSTGGRIASFAPDGAPGPHRARGVRRAVQAAIAARPPHLVAAHFALYALPVLDLLRDLPLVVHFHGPWALESEIEGQGRLAIAAKRLVERLVYRRASRVIVCSDAFGRLLQSEYGVPASIIRLVPNGADMDRFAVAMSRAEARAALGWPADRPILLSVRRLVRRMGLGSLIEAVALLRRTQPDLLLCIAGTGPLHAELELQAQATGLAGSVRFLGRISDTELPLAYRAADLSVVPTLALEGFGLVAVESLAAGTPVIVTPRGGLPEVVEPLSPELVTAGTGAAEIAAALDRALSNPTRLPSEAACREYARTHFDWRRIGAVTADVYREVA